MNAKERNLARFYDARTQHFKWFNSVKLLVSGFEIDKGYLTPIPQDTAFGRWFYTEALQFSRFQSKNVLLELENILESIYAIYTKIYAIYYGEKKSAIKSLLGIRQMPNKYEQELASRYYEDLVVLLDKFKNRFKLFESQLISMSEEKHRMVNTIKEEQKQEQKEQKLATQEEEGVFYHGPRSH